SRLKNGAASPSKKHISLLFGILFLVLLHLKHQDSTPPKSSLHQEYTIGNELISTHQWNAALLHFEDLYQKTPYHRQTVLRLLDTYHALERWKDLKNLSSKILAQGFLPEIAQKYQTICVAKKPRITVLEETFVENRTTQNALQLANECYRRGEYAQSAHFARWVLKHEPNSEDALLQLGEAYFKLGNHHDAKRAFQKAGSLTPMQHANVASME
ncbi:MAG: tetratricopeptide repeat protein, partial [Bacteroidota bacterium]